MTLAKKELGEIYDDWRDELDKHRKIGIPPDIKKEIIKYIKDARTDTGKGVVSYNIISKLIKERFKFTVCHSAVREWNSKH